MAITFPGESPAYRAARNTLLDAEIALRRQMEAVAQLRRALPPGGEIPEDYVFESTTGPRKLSELFSGGHDTLVVYSMMFPRDPRDHRAGPTSGETAQLALEESPCPSCVALLDQLDGMDPHVTPHLDFVVLAKAPIARITAFAKERAYRHLRFFSSANNSFNRDYHAESDDGTQMPMLNVFVKNDPVIRHFWGSELLHAPSDPGQDPRHVGTLEPVWNLFDLTPRGRDEHWEEQLAYDSPSHCCNEP